MNDFSYKIISSIIFKECIIGFRMTVTGIAATTTQKGVTFTHVVDNEEEINKAISMMRGKSPRSYVEMTKN